MLILSIIISVKALTVKRRKYLFLKPLTPQKLLDKECYFVVHGEGAGSFKKTYFSLSQWRISAAVSAAKW